MNHRDPIPFSDPIDLAAVGDVAAWLDGRLTDAERDAFEARLADDPSLRAIVASHRLAPATADDIAAEVPEAVLQRAIAIHGTVAPGASGSSAATRPAAGSASTRRQRGRPVPALTTRRTPTTVGRIAPWAGSLAACLLAAFAGLRSGSVVGQPEAPATPGTTDVAAADIDAALDGASFGLFRDEDGGTMLLTAYTVEAGSDSQSEEGR